MLQSGISADVDFHALVFGLFIEATRQGAASEMTERVCELSNPNSAARNVRARVSRELACTLVNFGR